MRVLNDYECTNCGLVEEHFLENDLTQCTCLQCGGVARKQQAVPNFQLPGNDKAGFPTAYDKWDKKRREKMAHEKRQGHTAFGE